MVIRCAWANSSEAYIKYHDREWGVPVYDDTKLFEFLVLEGAQAGLSWQAILQRRQGYRQAFAHFNAAKVAAFGEADTQRLLADAGIIRNKLKVRSAITNARHFLDVQKEFGSFSAYQWQFVGGRPIQNNWADPKDVPATSAEAQVFSRDLKRRGFTFVGPTIMYAHMQAMGMVNDHTVDCFRHMQVQKLAK